MVFAPILLIAVAALALLRLTGLRGPLLTLGATALALGGAGYALTGRPGLPGAPREMAERVPPMPLDGPRHALMGSFTNADHWLIIADSFERRGNTADAVGLLRSAVREHPRDYVLWVGLGNALTDHARAYTPAAAFAFDRAAELAPRVPAPRFFRGLALVRSGQLASGAAQWRALLADAPADASWRPMVEDGLLAVSGGSEPLPAAPKR
ncbi:MAG: tetratricopeptide repeat protein [Sphingomicrobium sp.]